MRDARDVVVRVACVEDKGITSATERRAIDDLANGLNRYRDHRGGSRTGASLSVRNWS